MKLYYVPRTRAIRPRWLLEELGAPYELVRLDPARQENKTPAYLAIHPRGSVPALVDGDAVMFESAAILLYLADRFADKNLAPKPSTPARARYYQWMIFAVTELEPHVATFGNHTQRLPEAERAPAVAAAARTRFVENARLVAAAVAGRDFLLGDAFTAADVMMASVLGWAERVGLLADLPDLAAYARRCADRPAAKRARAD